MNVSRSARLLTQRALYLNRMVLLYTDLFGWRRGLPLLSRSRSRSDQVIELAWPGFARPFTIRNCESDLQTFSHVISRDGYQMPFDSNPSFIVDLGANIGLSSAWFAARYPDSRVVAVEPDADNFELLLSNTSAFSNVTAVRAALWTRCGKVGLADPGIGPDGYRVDATINDAGSHQPLVDAVDMPTLLADHGIDRIDILKVDIEGSEREVFDASSHWIDRVDSIAIELHDRYKPGCSRAFFRAVSGFPNESARGEDFFVWRHPHHEPA